jgi:hypothetical protein
MRRTGLLVLASLVLLAACTVPVSSDPFTNSTSAHATQVEPDTFAFGSTIVGTFQSGRFFDGGASAIGWATSTDGGSNWRHGFLSGITKYQGNGPYDRASDPSVAYDARHQRWLINALALTESGGNLISPAVLVSRSTDGITWSATPVTAATGTNLDKNWIACDNSAASPYYGHCYVEYDDNGNGNRMHLATSTDGGVHWSEATVPAASGIGGQPLAQPGTGKVVVPYSDGDINGTLHALVSTDGGATYTGPVTIASYTSHIASGPLRTAPLPSAEVDGTGKIFLAWQDCRFRTNCASNDIVISTSTNGTTWSAPARVPIDVTTSGADHFIPGLGVDVTTSGSTARLALAYYSFPTAGCSTSSCRLALGVVTSNDGGSTWSAPTVLVAGMQMSWLADTNQGRMVGDYISTSFSGGKAFPMFAVAKAPNGSTFDESISTVPGGVSVASNAASTRAMRAGAPVASLPVPTPAGAAQARTAR